MQRFTHAGKIFDCYSPGSLWIVNMVTRYPMGNNKYSLGSELKQEGKTLVIVHGLISCPSYVDTKKAYMYMWNELIDGGRWILVTNDGLSIILELAHDFVPNQMVLIRFISVNMGPKTTTAATFM